MLSVPLVLLDEKPLFKLTDLNDLGTHFNILFELLLNVKVGLLLNDVHQFVHLIKFLFKQLIALTFGVLVG